MIEVSTIELWWHIEDATFRACDPKAGRGTTVRPPKPEPYPPKPKPGEPRYASTAHGTEEHSIDWQFRPFPGT